MHLGAQRPVIIADCRRYRMVQRLFRLPRLDRLEKAPLVPVDDHVNRKIAQVLTGQHVELPPRLTQARDAHLSDEEDGVGKGDKRQRPRSEEHTSELQSLMRISYAVFCLKK